MTLSTSLPASSSSFAPPSGTAVASADRAAETALGAARKPATMRRLVTHGLLAGLAGTEALDAVSTWLYEAESPWDRFREDARRFDHAYERAVERIAARFGKRLSHREKKVWGWRFHKAFGFAGGLLYVALRRRFPVVARGNGLVFGAAFFLLIDELLLPLAGLAPGPRAFDLKVHGRGAVSHLAWGVAAETAVRLVESFQKKLAAR